MARSNPTSKYGGVVGTAAATGLLGRHSQIAAKTMGMGKPKEQGGVTSQTVLNSGVFNRKEKKVVGAAIKLVKGRLDRKE